MGKSENSAKMKKEGNLINKSLSQLQLVVKQITKKEEHVSYRDSLLTEFLCDSLNGNFMTSVLITASSD